MENGKKYQTFPGLDNIASKLIYRTPGIAPQERMGLGFLSKNYRVDFQNYTHPNFVLIIVIQGSGQYIDNHGNSYELSAGSCFKRFPGRMHSTYIDPDSGWLEYFLEIGPALYHAALEMRIIRKMPPVEAIALDADFIRRLWRLSQRLQAAEETELPIIAGEVFSILGECRGRSDCPPDARSAGLLDEACEELSRNFDKPYNVKDFCRKRGIGYESFRKLFKQQNGVSPWRYRILRRLDSASAMLRNQELKISDIAAALGYSSQFEFSAQFKKHFGSSPANHRRPGQKSSQ